MSLDLAVLHTYAVAVYEARIVAEIRRLPVEAMELRAVAVELTETGGKNMANDGLAFHPDIRIRRPGWDRDDDGVLLPDDLIARCYEVVRRSLLLPHTGVGNNGGSTGPCQQLSKDYVRARFPGATWGWGSLADTMDLRRSPRMFLDAVQITDNPLYQHPQAKKPILTADPILADVLRVQNPKLTESSANYGGGKAAAVRAVLAEVREYLRQLPPGAGPDTAGSPDSIPSGNDLGNENRWCAPWFTR